MNNHFFCFISPIADVRINPVRWVFFSSFRYQIPWLNWIGTYLNVKHFNNSLMVIAWVYFIIKTISVLLFKGHSKTGIPTFIVSIWKQRFLFLIQWSWRVHYYLKCVLFFTEMLPVMLLSPLYY